MTKLIVGNWKMYPTITDSVVLVQAVKHGLESVKGVDVVIAPPTSWLVSVHENLGHRLPNLHLAAQNIWPEDQGAYTGEVSAYFLKDIISYVILGHSERRTYQGETNELIGKKVSAALKWGIKPIVCVGEKERMIDDNGNLVDPEWQKVSEQIVSALSASTEQKRRDIVIAYEPIWAIGSQNPAKPDYVLAVIQRFRGLIATKFNQELASSIKFLYGGSVNANNSASYLQYPDVSGFLVGSASVKSKDFVSICEVAASIK